MKSKNIKDKKAIRLQILESAISSFKIEGITITKEVAIDTLKKVELILGK